MEEKKIKMSLNQKFKGFLFTLAPILIIVGLATGTLFSVVGGVGEYSPKTIDEITSDRYKRVTSIEHSETCVDINLKSLQKVKYKRTTKNGTEVKAIYYMMEKSHLLFTYTVYQNDKISISIEGEEKYYSILED